jgi:phenylacetate-CoA ligase
MTAPARLNPGSRFRDLDEARRILRPRNRSANPEMVASDRLERLRRTISWAYEEVPYYRGIFDRSGIRPADIRSINDLGKLPLTAKLDFRAARREDLVSDRFSPESLLVFKTSGSTGIPIDILQSPRENFIFHLIKFRTLRDLGLAWRDRTIKIRNRFSSRPPGIWSILQLMGFLRQETIDAGTPEEMTAAIRVKKADVVMGYTGTLVRIAQILADDLPRALRPRFLVGGSETMTPFFRSEIRRGFGSPVLDTYICQEAGMVAWECPTSGLYHLLDDTLIIEVLRNGVPCAPGEEGEVVITSLVSRAMPIIRYRLGDIVKIAPGGCPCGRPGPAFERILGKTQDYFWLPGGREFNPWHLSGLWTGAAPWIRQYEIVQETSGSIVMRIVPAAAPPPGDLAALSDRSRKILGPDVDFRVELVTDIRPGPGGKMRFHRSLVRSIYDNPADSEWLAS